MRAQPKLPLPVPAATDAAPSGAVGTGERVADHAEHVRRLFEVHNRALVNFLAARLNSVPEARDVAQEAYARLLQLENPSAVSFLRAYLFRIAANLAIDRQRQRKVQEEGTPHEFFESLLTRASPERIVLAEQQLAVIVNALEELPEKCRRVFALYYFADKSLHDIATATGLGGRMVQKYVARGLAHCRARLADADAADYAPGDQS